MKFKIEIECDNAAFAPTEHLPLPESACLGVRRILKRIDPWDVAEWGERKVMDTNGNTVGRAWFEE